MSNFCTRHVFSNTMRHKHNMLYLLDLVETKSFFSPGVRLDNSVHFGLRHKIGGLNG